MDRSGGDGRSLESTAEGPPPKASDPLLGVLVDRKYEIRAVLGRGGMGSVYEARHLALDKVVAIKVMQPRGVEGDEVAVARFYEEARIAGSLGHPNICEVYDFGLLDDGRPYLVMERLIGKTARAHLAELGPLSEGDAMEITAQVLGALAAAHESGVVHRDVKPDNIFLARQGGGLRIVKLLDFGVAKALADLASTSPEPLTSTGTVVGTLYYMAPEQLGAEPVDGRADLYALGVVLFELLTGQRPFEGNQTSVVHDVLTRPAPAPSSMRAGVSRDVDAVVHRALAKDPDDRFQDAQGMLDALLGTRAFAPTRSMPAPPTSTPAVSSASRRDEQFRHLVAAFGTFSAAFNEAQHDGAISVEESHTLRRALSELERWSKHMREELTRAGDQSAALHLDATRTDVDPKE